MIGFLYLYFMLISLALFEDFWILATGIKISRIIFASLRRACFSFTVLDFRRSKNVESRYSITFLVSFPRINSSNINKKCRKADGSAQTIVGHFSPKFLPVFFLYPLAATVEWKIVEIRSWLCLSLVIRVEGSVNESIFSLQVFHAYNFWWRVGLSVLTVLTIF